MFEKKNMFEERLMQITEYRKTIMYFFKKEIDKIFFHLGVFLEQKHSRTKNNQFKNLT